MGPERQVIVAARRQLHAVAENFIAGPQYRAAGTIRLAARPDGILGTTLSISIVGTTLALPTGRAPLTGSVNALARAFDVDVGPPPASLYEPVTKLAADAVLDIDPVAADLIYHALYAGHRAVKAVLPEQDPILWPEHFDVGAAMGDINYGVSAGDDFHDLPYAYVAPWDFATHPRSGPLWNAPFGALHPLQGDLDTDALTADITRFFRQVQSHL